MDKSQEEWVKKIPKESKSYEFTYKILFNVDKVESESNKPQVKTEILQPIGPKPKAINFNSIEKMEVQEEIQQKINQFCLCVKKKNRKKYDKNK